MDRHIYDGENTICQTIRDMYHMTDNADIRLKCRLAMSMAKSMCKRMMYYRDLYGPSDGEGRFQDGI